MAVIFDGTNTKYGSLPNTSYFHRTTNFTFALWFKPAGGTNQQFIGGEDQNAGGSTRYTGFAYRGNVDDDGEPNDEDNQISIVRASVETHHNLGIPVLNNWNIAVMSRPNSATAVATPSALNNTDSSPSTLINQDFELLRFIIGARRVAGGSTYTDLFNGKIGCWAIWNRVLTSGEIDSLQGGAHPSSISSGLVDYMDISGSGAATTLLTNAGTTMTFVGSPALDDDTPFGPTIVSINGEDEPELPDESENLTVVTENLGTVTSGALGGRAVTINSTGANTCNIDFPQRADGMTWPSLPATVNLLLTDGVDLPILPVDITLRADEDKVVFADVDATTQTGLGYHMAQAGYPISNDDESYYPSADGDLIINPDSSVDINALQTVFLWIRRNSDEVWNSFNVTFENNAVVSVDRSVKKLTSSNITAKKITAKKISSKKF